MWKIPGDTTDPVITARGNIGSPHRKAVGYTLPGTAILFCLGGMEVLTERAGCRLIAPDFPRFLYKCPVYALNGRVCFLDGGRGAPQAADTLETLAALGVKRAVSVGLCGALAAEKAAPGSVFVPDCAFIEEGTSLHYLGADARCAEPDERLSLALSASLGVPRFPVVSTDAVYRQTYRKEQAWRESGAVGVDMETSALFTVGREAGVATAAVLMCSDAHPTAPGAGAWSWIMTDEMRRTFIGRVTDAVLALGEETGQP